MTVSFIEDFIPVCNCKESICAHWPAFVNDSTNFRWASGRGIPNSTGERECYTRCNILKKLDGAFGLIRQILTADPTANYAPATVPGLQPFAESLATSLSCENVKHPFVKEHRRQRPHCLD